jgi:selenide,water dikinase
MYGKGETTGSNKTNLELVRDFLRISARITEDQRQLLFDPQTSGGLLLSVPESRAQPLLNELRSAGLNSASMVGKVLKSPTPEIVII